MSVTESTYYRRQHVTGPGCVLVSVKFGKTPEVGVLIVKRLSSDKNDAIVTFDLENHIAEVLDGVREANIKYGGTLEVQEIEIVPNDYPTKGQAKYAAFKIAEHVIKKNI